MHPLCSVRTAKLWLGICCGLAVPAVLVGLSIADGADKVAAKKAAAPAKTPAGDAEKSESLPKKAAFSTGSAEVLVDFINEKIRKGWTDNDIQASPVADDEEWLRRVYLDIVGHVPSVEELEAFTADKDKAKRSIVIDKLLDDPGFVRQQTVIWTNLLIGRNAPNNQMGGDRRRAALAKFLRESFAKNRPWSEIVYDLLSAEGHFEERGEVNFLLTHLNDGAVPATAISARLFLGTQVQCTQCHNHPFNDWKQNAFWEFNSFFKQAQANEVRKYNPKTGRMEFDYVELVRQDFEGPVYFEQRNGLMKVAYPIYAGTKVPEDLQTDRRLELAKLVTAGERPLIADAMVNRMWGHFFGYGFTKPVDDMGPHNAPSHPELLERLSVEFVKGKYDLKQLVRWICNSEAYNLTSRFGAKNEADNPAAGETPMFSHLYVKSMTAEQLYDSLIVATNAHKSGRANWEQAEQQRQAWMQQFVIAFGTDENDEATTFNGTIPQALMMMNGELVQNAISEKKGSYLNDVLSEKANEQAKIRHLYLATLSRPPSKKEIGGAQKVLKGAKNPVEAYQDLFWALLNSNEFICNH